MQNRATTGSGVAAQDAYEVEVEAEEELSMIVEPPRKLSVTNR